MAGKWLELLKEIAPRVNRVAFLFNPATAPYAEYYLNSFKAAAPSFAMEPVVGGLIVTLTGFTIGHRDLIITLAARHRLPARLSHAENARLGAETTTAHQNTHLAM
jgi:putative ABC transport system substrate-binding protein